MTRRLSVKIPAGVDTGARIRVAGGEANGVVLASGEEIPARAVISNADPKRTFLGLLDPVHLDPDFLGRVRNYRSFGSAAKVHFALASLPEGQRVVLELLYLQDLTQRQVADRVGVPLGTVKTRAFYGLRALKEALRQRDVDV